MNIEVNNMKNKSIGIIKYSKDKVFEFSVNNRNEFLLIKELLSFLAYMYEQIEYFYFRLTE